MSVDEAGAAEVGVLGVVPLAPLTGVTCLLDRKENTEDILFEALIH